MARGIHINGGGPLNQAVTFFTMAETRGSSGGVTRTPTIAFKAYAAISPFRSDEMLASGRELGATWATVTIRFHRSRLPVQGMTMRHEITQQIWQVRGVQPVDWDRHRIELTCEAQV